MAETGAVSNFFSKIFTSKDAAAANDNVSNSNTSNTTTTKDEFDNYITAGRNYVDKDNDKALESFQKALVAAKGNPDKTVQAKLWIAKMELILKNYRESERLYKEVLKSKLNDTDNEAALEGLIRTYTYSGDTETAIEIIPVNYNFKTPGLVLALAEAYVKAGKEAQAASILSKNEKVLETIPPDSYMVKLKNNLNAQISKHHDNDATDESSEDYNKLMKEAHYTEYLNDNISALEFYEKANKASKNDLRRNIPARLGIAKMNYALKNYTVAKNTYKDILKEDLEKNERSVATEGLRLAENPQNSEKSQYYYHAEKAPTKSAEKPAVQDIYGKCIDPCLLKEVERRIECKDAKGAVALLDNQRYYEPQNAYLLLKEAAVLTDSERYRLALHTLDIIDSRFPIDSHYPCVPPETEELRCKIKDKLYCLPHNEVNVFYDRQYVSDIQQYWTFQSISYFRIENYIKYGFSYNSASRLGFKGNQSEFIASIDLYRNLRLALDYAYASKSQVLYPNRQYYGEVFYTTLCETEFSAGQEYRQYITFHNQSIIRTTFSVGQYFCDKYFIWARLNRYTFQHSRLGQIGITRFFGNNDFVSFELVSGRSPDITNLPPLDQMDLLKQTGYSFRGQVEISPSLFVRVGLGFYKQYYPTFNLHRHITDSYVNLTWRF